MPAPKRTWDPRIASAVPTLRVRDQTYFAPAPPGSGSGSAAKQRNSEQRNSDRGYFRRGDGALVRCRAYG